MLKFAKCMYYSLFTEQVMTEDCESTINIKTILNSQHLRCFYNEISLCQ